MAAATSSSMTHLSGLLPSASPPRLRRSYPFLSSSSSSRRRLRTFRSSRTAAIVCFSDPFVLELAEKIEDSVPPLPSSPPLPLLRLRESASRSLLSQRWPTQKDEAFRFTDTRFLRHSLINPVQPSSVHSSTALDYGDDDHRILHIVDGQLLPSSPPSISSDLPESVFVGPLSAIQDEALLNRVLSSFSSDFQEADLFWSLNGIGVPDVVVIFIPTGCIVEKPLHFVLYSNQGGGIGGKNEGDPSSVAISNPRMLVLVEAGGQVGIVEEFVGSGDSGAYWTNSVIEMVIEEGGKVSHTYIQRQADNSTHTKWTRVHQATTSSYNLIETSTGGKLSRHNLHIQQHGSDTVTELSTFHLAGSNQAQDLHSRLVLDHPRGYGRQLHKCIVADSSGQAIFDGNIQVNKYAQQTDAGQLTRSLLLAPRATVNVKPNLQIVADDVKCSHGAAISDLEDDQLFYFQARGVDLQTARNALIFSFAAEVIERLPSSLLRRKVEDNVKSLLAAKGAIL
ncbi:ABCI7 protein [Nymphaea thermarum]|nr:ABCI7 protein [Nymphaea thermarum]